MTKLRVAFMGTPDFAVPPLQSLAAAGHDVVAVYCQPPKPAGRGQKIRKSPVHEAAEILGLSVHTPKSLRDTDVQEFFRNLHLDVAIVAAYGLILPSAILMAPRLGCLNIHASLLPRWRGAAPIQRSLLADDNQTGITIMQMDAGLDTGAILSQETCPITEKTTAGELHDTLMMLGTKLIIPTLQAVAEGTIRAIPQPESGVTYASKLTREDGRICWRSSAYDIERQIRALQPWPGCYFELKSEAIKVLSATIIDKSAVPGTLLDVDMTIACGEKALRLTTVQRAGKSVTDGASFLRGQRLSVGMPL